MKLASLGIIAYFYVGWFGSVFLAETAYSQAALLFPLALIIFLILRHKMSALVLLNGFLFAFIGIVFDSIMVHAGFTEIPTFSGWIIPEWLVSIWLLFSVITMLLGKNLKIPYWVALILGFIFGPLSYHSGNILGVFRFLSFESILIYAIFWSIMFSGILKLSKRYS